MSFTEAGFKPRPVLIQGGMGVNVSTWELARAVSIAGQEIGQPTMGVVSGTGYGIITARSLQLGDPGGHFHRALETFPFQEMAERVWDKYYIHGGKALDAPFKSVPMVNYVPRREVEELIICANYALVWLAKQGHNGPVGINFLEKLQSPHLPEIYGAILAQADTVLMGAGIPDQVPGVLDKFAANLPASYFLEVDGRRSAEFAMKFDPADYIPEKYWQQNKRPDFYAIIASNVLAKALTSKSRMSGEVDGFIIENHTAGGHNAPPRDKSKFNETGEPVYGLKDEVNLQEMKDLGIPFWLAGSYASRTRLAEALAFGATGIQAGTIFALSEESGIREEIKRDLIKRAFNDNLLVLSDPKCSPSGFPFNVVQLDETVSNPLVYQERPRVCDIGYLRTAYRKDNGAVGFRCPSEPVNTYLKRGGKIEDTVGRKCLCNGLIAANDLGQMRDGMVEPPIVTLGRDTSFIKDLISSAEGHYTATKAVAYLLGN